MIQLIKLIRNVGMFGSSATTASILLKPLVLLYGENGSGKTTLAAVMRSLATGEALPLTERQRLGSSHLPHVVLQCDGNPSSAVFQNGAWNRQLTKIRIFDDEFIDNNVYSGLNVDAKHRQQLHNLIIGEEGVALQRRIEQLVSEIGDHNTEIQEKAKAIPKGIRGTLTVDEFCDLPKLADADSLLNEAEQSLKVASDQTSIRTTRPFQTISLPHFDVDAVTGVLTTDLPSLDKAAEENVRQHIQLLGEKGEPWIASGMSQMAQFDEEICPFCGQDISAVELIQHYRAFFGQQYELLKQQVVCTYNQINDAHGHSNQIAFIQAVTAAKDAESFWSRYCTTPLIDLDAQAIVDTWTNARDLVLAHLRSKQAAPLERQDLSSSTVDAIREYDSYRDRIIELNEALTESNQRIADVQKSAQTADTKAILAKIERITVTKERHKPEINSACENYLNELKAKSKTEAKRAAARNSLKEYREKVFPALQLNVNHYLERFNAGFRVDSLTPTNIGGGSGSACTYELVIRNAPIAVSGAKHILGIPSFRNSMSAGDRNTLALALFFSALDQSPELIETVVVIDDPISSLDDHRSMTTVHELRDLVNRTKQVFVLSHNKRFLCSIWEGTKHKECTPLKITPDGDESSIVSWDVTQDAFTEHDHRHKMLHSYADTGSNPTRDLARLMRPHLEGFIRVAFPDLCPPGSILRPFVRICHKKLGQSDEVLSAGKIQELEQIIDYANQFHHDTNPAWESMAINGIELRGFVRRTLSFTRPTG